MYFTGCLVTDIKSLPEIFLSILNILSLPKQLFIFSLLVEREKKVFVMFHYLECSILKQNIPSNHPIGWKENRSRN